jgi:hypothetical protein
MAAARPPALSNADITRIRGDFTGYGLVFPGLLPQLAARGRQDFSHFWLYSEFAVSFVWIARHAGVHPGWAFTWLNILCLLGAAAITAPRLGVRATLLLFASPILWWSDKVHVEAFLFALMVAGLVLIEEFPIWGFALLGLAAAQNPAIGIVLLVFAAASGWQQPNRIPPRRFAIAAVIGLLIASIHPLYYALRLRMLTPLTVSTDRHLPASNELLAVLIDPNIGLLPNACPVPPRFRYRCVVASGLQWCAASTYRRSSCSSCFPRQRTSIWQDAGMSQYGLISFRCSCRFTGSGNQHPPRVDRAFTTVVTSRLRGRS